MKAAGIAGMVALALGSAAHAEVAQQWDGGFTIKNVVQVKAKPDRAYVALGELSRWWSKDHTYSGKSENLTLAMKPGGCWCEALPGGGVEHGRVVLAWPAQWTLRLDAALGPLQEMGITARLTYVAKANGAGSEVTQTYTVSGRSDLGKAIAVGVDGVMSEALTRYKRYVDTGKPE